jgi:hypothetical protein
MSERCFRCGRPLSNLKSQEIGYGPICLKKANEDREKLEKEFKPTIVDEELAFETRRKIQEQIDNLQEPHDRCKSVNCKRLVRKGTLASYDHEGGIDAPGYGAKQWFYVHCQKCKYDLAIWKAGIYSVDAEVKKTENLESPVEVLNQ